MHFLNQIRVLQPHVSGFQLAVAGLFTLEIKCFRSELSASCESYTSTPLDEFSGILPRKDYIDQQKVAKRTVVYEIPIFFCSITFCPYLMSSIYIYSQVCSHLITNPKRQKARELLGAYKFRMKVC